MKPIHSTRIHPHRVVASDPVERVLVIAERGVDLRTRLANLASRGYRATTLSPRAGEDDETFRRRLAELLAARVARIRGPRAQVMLVARKPIGPRLNELVRTIVAALPQGASLLLAAEEPSPYAARALAALALTVEEMCHGVEVTAEPGRSEEEATEIWHHAIDAALKTLLEPPAGFRHAG